MIAFLPPSRYNFRLTFKPSMSSFIDNKSAIAALFQQALFIAYPALKDEVSPFVIEVEKPKNPDHGHFAVNSALQLAKKLGAKPRDIAMAIVTALPPSDLLGGTPEVAGPGFINIRLSSNAESRVVSAVFAAADDFGKASDGNGEKVMVEFVSANPTGPLHVGHGRGAATGDTIARLLETQGYQVSREFYYNDAGAQINNLALSVQARLREKANVDAPFPENGYRGDYIVEIAERYALEFLQDPLGDDLDAVQKFAVAALRYEQDLDLKAFDVQFDVHYLESSLYTDGLVEKTVAHLVKMGHTYEKDGALWLKSTDFGDDKDRVMRKSDGSYTYFVPDVAYHLDKWRRGFTRVINEQGADHHSTITRVRAGLQALGIGIPQGWPDYVLHQMVTVLRNGEEMKISKRAGSYVTLRDLIDEVGCDATRFFLAARHPDSQLVFDIDLAKSQNNENPVYYIQYAHARICSVLGQWGGDAATLRQADMSALESDYERVLLQRLIDYPQVIESAAEDLAPHLIAFYLKDLAADFHSYYNASRFLVEEEGIKQARLALIAAVAQVMRNGLVLLGVSAPEKM